MNMGDVEGGPKRMVRRYATACRMCGIDSQGPQGPAFFVAIFGDDDSAISGIERSEIIAWRRYVCENVPVSRHGPEVTEELLAALEVSGAVRYAREDRDRARHPVCNPR